MPATARPSTLRKVLEDQFSIMVSELVALYEHDIAATETEQRESIRSELAGNLNQAVRLLRQAEDFQQIAAVLVDSSATFAAVFAVFSINGDSVRAERIRGVSEDAGRQISALPFPIEQAAALAGAIQTGDPVVAMTTPREISAVLAQGFAHKADDRAYIFPILVHGKPVGLIYASGAVEMAPLELLAQAATLSLEATAPPAPPPHIPDLVLIQPVQPQVPRRKIPDAWSELAPPDQELHLRAQRFARVHVAGMQLFSPELVQKGRASKDLYGVLQKDIDSGREMFRQTFLTASSTIVDYFHVELLSTLANDDASLLGEKYPGPLV